jgi:hypothetical protein
MRENIKILVGVSNFFSRRQKAPTKKYIKYNKNNNNWGYGYEGGGFNNKRQ